MQGVYFLAQSGTEFFKFKKDLRTQAASDPSRVLLEGTDVVRREYTGALDLAPDGEYSVAGPDVYNHRQWYATIVKQGNSFEVK